MEALHSGRKNLNPELVLVEHKTGCICEALWYSCQCIYTHPHGLRDRVTIHDLMTSERIRKTPGLTGGWMDGGGLPNVASVD